MTWRLFWLLTLLPVGVLAQRRVPGYVVTTAGDSLLGVLRLPDLVARQSSLRFARHGTTRPQRWQPAQVRAYGYVAREQAVRYVQCRLPGWHTTYEVGWLRQVQQGRVDLFELRRPTGGGRSGGVVRQEYWIRRGNQALENTFWWHLRVQGAAYFADYAPVAAALRSGRCGLHDLPRLVALYNHGSPSGPKSLP